MNPLAVFFKVNFYKSLCQTVCVLKLGINLLDCDPAIWVLFFMECMGPEEVMLDIEVAGSLIGLLIGCQQKRKLIVLKHLAADFGAF